MTSTAESLDFLRRLHGSGRRTRSRAELRADLMAGCQSLGELAAEWHATGYVPDTDLAAIDRTIAGLQQVLVALRAEEESPNAA